LYYELKNTNPDSVPVDGLGILPGDGVVRVDLDSDAAVNFAHTRGLSLAQVNLPHGVEVTAVIEGAHA
jgi:hypothetical protein